MPSSSHSNRDESEMSPPSSQNGTRGPNSTIASSIPPSSSGSNQAPSGLSHVETPKTDAEGFSIPTSHDPIQDMMGENGSEEHQPQFKVEIKNDVIQEEEGEADAALSKVANTLRAQNTVSRRVRGRRDARDVRNTMYVPNPPELSESFGSKPSESFSSTASPPLTPIKLLPRSSTITSASEAGSDTQSIRSSRSMSSLSAHIMRHPELTEAGLSASIIESVNASFEPGNPVKVQVIGEVAISYHPHDTAPPAEKASIRLDNFEVLEKVAPNPAFLSALPGKMGEYSISLNSLRKTAVALKYQVHVDPANSHHFYPIIVSSTWRLEPHQSSVILTWKPNPDFRSATSEPIFLRNVMFMIGIEGAHASSCQSKPVGTFSREKGRIMWKMDSITIDPSKPDEVGKMLARFATDGQARAGPAEARWEITDSTGMGSTLALSVEEKKMEAVEEDASDPFADDGEKPASEEESEGASDAPKTNWQNVKTVRKLMSGKYIVI